MLVWSMRCSSVLLLGLIGIEGTRVFRKNCSVTTIRFAKTKIRLLCNFFAIEDSFPSSARRKWAAVRPICRFSGLQSTF